MKKLFLLLSASLMLTSSFANDTKEAKNLAKGDEYRRSSLCLIMAKDSSAPMADVIETAFLNSPMPDKYNDHNVGVRIFSTDDIKMTDEDKELFDTAVALGRAAEAAAAAAAKDTGEEPVAAAGAKKPSAMGGLMRAVASDATGGTVSEESKDVIAAMAYKYLHQSDFAYQLASQWFGGVENNTANIINDRGLYDASALRIEEAAASFYGIAELKEAGESLIPNTFAVVSRYEYLSKDELIAQMEKVIMLAAEVTASLLDESKRGMVMMSAKASIVAMKASMGDGYYVKTRSFLFQLDWSDDMLQFVGENLWNNPEAWAANKDKFKLKYIGNETAWAKTKAGIFTNKPEDELIRIATINAMDDVLAKLEKKYEVFKTKVPLLVEEVGEGKKATQLLSARIGMKDGLSGGEKFEVLEAKVNEETGKVRYKKIGTVKVNKNQVWDNRFMADEEYLASGKEQEYTATYFDGGKSKFYSGCVLRQIK